MNIIHLPAALPKLEKRMGKYAECYCNADEEFTQGERARNALLAFPVKILQHPHTPELTDTEKEIIINRIVNIATTETRSSFYYNAFCNLVDTVSGTAENPAVIPKIMLRWIGRIVIKPQKPKTKKAGHAKNGRVIKSTRTS